MFLNTFLNPISKKLIIKLNNNKHVIETPYLDRAKWFWTCSHCVSTYMRAAAQIQSGGINDISPSSSDVKVRLSLLLSLIKINALAEQKQGVCDIRPLTTQPLLRHTNPVVTPDYGK
jgi:hypothetical protein